MMPNGEKRVSITGAALSVGRAKDYLSKVVKTGSKSLQSLQALGFQGSVIEGLVLRNDGRGSPIAKTISIRDYNKYLIWEVVKNQRPEAAILLGAFSEVGIETVVDSLFAGRSIDFLLEKIVHYTKWTNNDLMQALAYNREDLALIEEQERFLREGE